MDRLRSGGCACTLCQGIDQLVLGGENTVSYRATYNGGDAGGGDNWQHIILNSWLVVYR